MKNKFMGTLTLLLGLLLLLSACGADASAPSLADTSWRLLSMPGDADFDAVEVSLNFDGAGGIGGNGGCNSYGGQYESFAAENTIKFSEIFSTMMFCEENNASAIEAAYFQALNEAQSYTQTFESLRISGPSGTLEFGLAP